LGGDLPNAARVEQHVTLGDLDDQAGKIRLFRQRAADELDNEGNCRVDSGTLIDNLSGCPSLAKFSQSAIACWTTNLVKG